MSSFKIYVDVNGSDGMPHTLIGNHGVRSNISEFYTKPLL
jgi:hypothetical protein